MNLSRQTGLRPVHAVAGMVLLMFQLLCGCSSSAYRASTEYQTVPHRPHRDTERASTDNAIAVQQIADGDYEQAEQTLRRALSADVTFGPAHNNLGKVYYHQSKFCLAAWEFEYAAQLMPHHPEPRNNLGLVFEHVGKLDEAVDWYGKAMDIQPDNPQIIGNVARARVRRGDRDKEVRGLLQELVMKDTRPDWIHWAQEKLHRMGRAPTD